MDNTPELIVLKFADTKVPVFKETRNNKYIKYGEKNDYPKLLTDLYNKSAKHNAILNGKANYIFGNGYENGDFVVNRNEESLNDISKKCILDRCIYGGFKLEIIWGFNKKIAEIYHVDYNCIRKGKEEGFYYKETWDEYERGDAQYLDSFDPSNPVGSQIFEYNEYRPGVRFYPLPDYIGCLNYVHTDIEIGKFHLSAITNGMAPSKMIQFFTGEPTEDKKREIEGRIKKKYTGAENAGSFFLVFNNANASKSVEITDLSASDLDKQMDLLNKTTQQEIFSGHGITSPMLFGIKTEGQLGGNTELQIAYSIFQNTYSKPKASDFDKEINWLLSYSNFPGVYELQASDPIGIQFDIKDVVNALPKEFVFESLGIPKEMWTLENIGSDNRPTPTNPVNPSTEISADATPVNDHLKNLSAKQLQHVTRVIKKYKKGEIMEPMARTLLRGGLGLSEDDISSFLGIPVKMSFSADDIINIFDQYGDSKNDFEIIKSKRVSFISELECEADEEIFIQQAFKDVKDLTVTEGKIVSMIEKDPLITPAVIAGVIKETVAFVESKIKSLIAKGFIEQSEETIGTDVILKRIIPKGQDIKIPPSNAKVNPAQIYIKYSYEGPQDSRNRPFCAKLLSLNRLYSRAQIEQISERLGYSVFDRAGGFWNKGNGVISPSCRHHWKSNIIIKKGGSNER